MQGRVVVAVAVPGRVRDLAVGHPKDPAGKARWVREAPACAAVRAGEGLQNPRRRKRYAPTAAEVQGGGREAAEVSVSDPAEVGEQASVAVLRLASGQDPVLAEADRA